MLFLKKHRAHNCISLELTTSLSSRFEKTKYLKCFWSHLIYQDCRGCYPYSRRKEKHWYDEKINQKTMKQVRKNLWEYSFLKNIQVIKTRKPQRVKQVNQKTAGVYILPRNGVVFHRGFLRWGVVFHYFATYSKCLLYKRSGLINPLNIILQGFKYICRWIGA